MANSFDVGAVTATVKADTTQFKQGIDEAKKKAGEFKDTLENIGKGIGDFANKASLFTGVLTAGIVLYGKQSVDAFTEADKEMASVGQTLKNVAQEMATTTIVVGGNTQSLKANIKELENRRQILKLSQGDHKAEIDSITGQINALKIQQLEGVKTVGVQGQVIEVANKNAKSFQELSDETAKVSEAYIQLGFDDENTALAFAKSLSVTKDVTQSKKDLALATDFARAKNIDLTTATDVLQLAYMGNAKALKSYGINVKDLANKQEIQGIIQEKVGGQAKAFAETYAGKLAILNVELANIQEEIGMFIVQGLSPLVDWFSKLANSDTVYNAIYKIAGVLQAVKDIVADGKLGMTLQNILGAQVSDPLITFLFQLHDIFIKLGAWINDNQALVIQFMQALAMTIGTLVIIGTINALLVALLNPFTLIVLAIQAFYFAFTTNFMGVRDITMIVVNAIIGFFNTILMPAIMVLVQFFIDNWGFISATVTMAWDIIKLVIGTAIDLIVAILGKFFTQTLDWFKAHQEQVKAIIDGGWKIIMGIIQVASAIISGIFIVLTALITGNWDKAFASLWEVARIGWEGIKNMFNGIISFISGWGGLLIDKLTSPFREAWKQIQDTIKKIQDGLDFTKRHSPSVLDIVKRGVGLVNNALGNLEYNTMLSPTMVAQTVSNGGKSMSVASINISLDGAIIGSSADATSIGEMIGDGIIKKLQYSVRI